MIWFSVWVCWLWLVLSAEFSVFSFRWGVSFWCLVLVVVDLVFVAGFIGFVRVFCVTLVWVVLAC